MRVHKEDIPFFIFAAILLVIAMVFSRESCANEPRFFGEVGLARYERPPCGLWHQECAGFETHWDMDRPMFRFGVDYSGLRVSYFDLGKYSIRADASDNEDCIFAGGTKATCAGDTDWYWTEGTTRGFALSYKFGKPIFFEIGPGYFRQSFSLEKDDGHTYRERQWGPGYLAGVGIQSGSMTIGLYAYQTNVGAEFERTFSPAGTGSAKVLTLGWTF